MEHERSERPPACDIKRLGLGTVQFGVDYGISNRFGRTDGDEAEGILRLAAKSGIRLLDTAANYGDSERVLGERLWVGAPFALVTKTTQCDDLRLDADHLRQFSEAFERSLHLLGQSKLYGLLVHNSEDLIKPGGERLYDWLIGLRDEGRVERVGVSVYNPESLYRILERFTIDLVQLPFNVFDRRMVETGMLAELKHHGIEVHARSIFLQGLLLMEPDIIPTHFESVRVLLRRYHRILTEKEISPLTAALAYCLRNEALDVVLCGVNDHSQLLQILKAADWVGDLPDLESFSVTDPIIVDPSRWVLTN